MSWDELVLAAIALPVGVLAFRWNATAVALTASWLFGQVLYHGFDYHLSRPELVYCDWTVTAIIMAKPELCNLRPYRSLWHQLSCLMLERSLWDRVILLLFVAAWVVYTIPLSPFVFHWLLFWIAVAQFIAAAGEASTKWLVHRMANADSATAPDNSPAGLEFTRPAWGGGYG